MKITNYGEKLEYQILLRLNNEEKQFLDEVSQLYNIKSTQYLRMILDWFMTHYKDLNEL